MSLPANAEPLAGKLWIPVRGFEQHLYTELAVSDEERAGAVHWGAEGYPVPAEVLIYRQNYPEQVFWQQLCFENPFIAHFGSIAEAAGILKSIQRNWVHYPVHCFRRSALITEKLPYISNKPKPFPYRIPMADMGVWSLLSEHCLIASARTSSPLPLGQIRFEEDHENPPSRAYLKLWEALSLLDYYYRLFELRHGTICGKDWALPGKDSVCVDAGACPGGWTWVLHTLGAHICAIDRSPLDDRLMRQPNIRFIKHDAFTLTPENLGPQDWLFSDVICYPARLLGWVERWLDSGLCNKFVCTIKMQGQPDFDTIRRFAAIPHSKIVHLTANKHELTWMNAPFLE